MREAFDAWYGEKEYKEELHLRTARDWARKAFEAGWEARERNALVVAAVKAELERARRSEER